MSHRALVLIPFLFGCGTGGAAEAVRPSDPTAENVLGEEAADCRNVENGAQPLVVDWKPEQRGDLEVAMKDGLAVVHYGCDGIKLLADCHVNGEYGFIGMTRKEQVVRLENADEVKANLPFTGGAVGGELSRGATIDIAMVMVGKRRTTFHEPSKEDLKGSCDGATHYVRGAMVGAFAVETGTRAKVRAAADVFAASASAESQSAKSMKNKDGDPSACAKASSNAETPPDQCGAAIRIVLGPIQKKAAETAEKAAPAPMVEVACPEGLVLAEGKCTKAETAKAYQCNPSQPDECKTQCEKGHAGSCAASGRHLASSDPASALAAFQKACEGGEATGCTGAGQLTKDPAAATALFEKGCAGGDAPGCREQGIALRAQDATRAVALFDQACDGGDDKGCAEAAKAYASGSGTAKDEDKAAKLHKRACDGTVGESCAAVGKLFERGGPGIGKNPILAEMMYRRGCIRGSGASCVGLGRALASAKPPRMDQAKLAFQQACARRNVVGCAAMKVLFGTPGATVDVKLKMDLTTQCRNGNDAGACVDAGLLDAAAGLPTSKIQLDMACKRGDAFACLVHEKAK